MKAERRQELQANSSALGGRNLSDFWRVYGFRIALGVLLVALAVILVQRWRAGREEERRLRAERLTSARVDLNILRKGPMTVERPKPLTQEDIQMIMSLPPQYQQQIIENRMRDRVLPIPTDQRVAFQNELWGRIETAVGDVLANSSEPAQQAEAKLLRADANLYWATLASIGDPPQATTRPELAVAAKRNEYLDKAASNYDDVAKQGSLSALQVGSAKLGLAAVAEAREQFDEAAKIYGALAGESGEPVIKQLAEARQRQLARLKTPPLIGAPRDPATLPAATPPATAAATQPTTGAATQPATGATTRPATMPAAVPATMPSTPATQPTTVVPATRPSTTAPSMSSTRPTTNP